MSGRRRIVRPTFEYDIFGKLSDSEENKRPSDNENNKDSAKNNTAREVGHRSQSQVRNSERKRGQSRVESENLESEYERNRARSDEFENGRERNYVRREGSRTESSTNNTKREAFKACLIQNIRQSNVSPMLGVFGMDSEDVVIDTLHEIDENIEVIGHCPTTFENDVYTLLAACFLNYINKVYNRVPEYIINELLRDLQKLTAKQSLKSLNHQYGYSNGLEYLHLLGEAQDVAVNCRRFLEDMKRKLNIPVNKKFIFHLEFRYETNFDMLRDLEKIQSPDLIIIVSSEMSVEQVQYALSQNYDGGFTDGYGLFLRYFNSRTAFEV